MAPSESDSSSPHASSLRVELSEDDSPTMVPIELVLLDSEHVFRFEVDLDASIGLVVAKFKKAAFEEFGSHRFFDSHENGRVVLINEGSTFVHFELSHAGAYTRFLRTKEVREFRRGRGGAPLLFQLIRCSVPS